MNKQVTIDAAYFAELYDKANENQPRNCDNCKEVHTRTRERDELKAALETANATNSAQADQLRDVLNELEKFKKLYSDDHERMDAAERCIDEVWVDLGTIYRSSEKRFDAIEDAIRTIRAYYEEGRAK